jgi:hypothetical protein
VPKAVHGGPPLQGAAQERARGDGGARARPQAVRLEGSWRGSCLPVERVLGGVPWCDKEEIFYVRAPEDSLFGEGKTAVFTEEFSFEGNSYQVEFRQAAAPRGKTIGAYLHMNGKWVQAQLPVVRFQVYFSWHDTAAQGGLESESSDVVCHAPLSGVSLKILNAYGSINIMRPLNWVHTNDENLYWNNGFDIFKGPHRVASFRISLRSA